MPIFIETITEGGTSQDRDDNNATGGSNPVKQVVDSHLSRWLCERRRRPKEMYYVTCATAGGGREGNWKKKRQRERERATASPTPEIGYTATVAPRLVASPTLIFEMCEPRRSGFRRRKWLFGVTYLPREQTVYVTTSSRPEIYLH